MWILIRAIWEAFFPIKEVKWEDYMGDWKEPCYMPKGNDFDKLNHVSTSISCGGIGINDEKKT